MEGLTDDTARGRRRRRVGGERAASTKESLSIYKDIFGNREARAKEADRRWLRVM